MRKYTDIAVKRAVVHVVAPRREVLHQSTAELDLDEPLRNFLTAHVTQGLADGKALAGKFKVVGAERTEGICRSIISSGTDFVPRSAALAQRLYDASSKPDGTDSRVSDGTLVVARCTATDGTRKNLPFVALLKLDPDDAFRADDGTDSKGRPVVKARRPAGHPPNATRTDTEGCLRPWCWLRIRRARGRSPTSR
jgi:37-kD nucleoid-associated bacterial protein